MTDDASNIDLNMFIIFGVTQFKTHFKPDAFFFFASFIAALFNTYMFCNAHRRIKTCFMFGKMYEIKRLVIPGPKIACNFFLISSILLILICLWTAMKTQRSNTYRFAGPVSKMSALLVPMLGVVNFSLLLMGNKAFCDSFDVHKFCSTEIFHNTDFKTFTPKYLDAYSYLDFSRISLISLAVLCILWTLGLGYHMRKHKYRPAPL